MRKRVALLLPAPSARRKALLVVVQSSTASRCPICLEATAPLRMAALRIALSLIVQTSTGYDAG